MRWDVRIVIHEDASSEPLKKLAERVERWESAEIEHGYYVHPDKPSMEDLKTGELPQPRALRYTSTWRKIYKQWLMVCKGQVVDWDAFLEGVISGSIVENDEEAEQSSNWAKLQKIMCRYPGCRDRALEILVRHTGENFGRRIEDCVNSLVQDISSLGVLADFDIQPIESEDADECND